jgi:RimJ/RimL family protein N-acetyltransferase
MTDGVSLRDVQEGDLPIFFEHQLDPEARAMAAFAARPYDAFMDHWAKCLAEKSNILKTILFRGSVAGNIVYWEQSGAGHVGYWLGKEHWGQGIATAALAQFLELVKARPLYAHVVKSNAASIRVLTKCGFTVSGEDTFDVDGESGSEFIMTHG